MIAGKDTFNVSRKPEIVADAAYYILTQDPATTTGNFFIDDEVLAKAGVTDFDQYCCNPEYKDRLMPDFYVDASPSAQHKEAVKAITEQEPVGKIGKLFKAIESNLSSELVEKTQAVFQFNVTGSEAGQWCVHCFFSFFFFFLVKTVFVLSSNFLVGF